MELTLILQVATDSGTGEAVVDVVSSIGIAALVNILLGAFGAFISDSRFKPPLALAMGVALAALAFVSVDGAYPNALTAFAVGLTAGAAASGIDSYRATYRSNV